MKINKQILAASLCLVLVLIPLIGIYCYMSFGTDYSAIEQIEESQKGPNSFNDLAGMINVKSADDIGYKINSDYNLTVYYGGVVIEIPPKAFHDVEFCKRLEGIGIDIKYRVNDDKSIDYLVTYWGTEVDEYALVN